MNPYPNSQRLVYQCFLLFIITGIPLATSHLKTLAAQQSGIQINQLSQETIESRLRQMPSKDADREKRLKESFEEVGCKGSQLTEQIVKHLKIPNLVCVLPGASESEIIIGAHLDHVNEGMGVVDNWSGASLLPSLYQSIGTSPRKHTIVFVAFAGEEEGLIGSAFYAKQLTAAQVAGIRAMINIDTLGLGPTNVWLTHSDKDLAAVYVSIAKSLHLIPAYVNADEVGDEDSSSFRKRKIPTVMFHSIIEDTFPILHTKDDNLSQIKMKDYYDSYHLISTYLAYIDLSLN